MTLDRTQRITRGVKRPLIGAISGFTIFGGVLAANVQADPADDALAKLNELSRQAERTTEAMHSAQLDLNNKLAAQQDADAKHAADQAAVDTAKAQLATFQSAVDKFAAAQYMGGRTDGMDAMLTADSPQRLIDQLSVQRVMAAEMSAQMKSYRSISEQAARAEVVSAKSAAEAKTAAEQAAAVRADLQIQAKPAAGADRRRQVAVPGPDTRPAGCVGGPSACPATAGRTACRPGASGGSRDRGRPARRHPTGRHRTARRCHRPRRAGGEGIVAMQAALTRVGSPYSWGGSGPNAFDCSGLVMWAFQQAGISLPHSSQALARGGQPVDMSQMQPGDVVTYYSDASHVAIYIGDGMMVHASTYGTPVRVAPVNNAPIYNVRRY